MIKPGALQIETLAAQKFQAWCMARHGKRKRRSSCRVGGQVMGARRIDGDFVSYRKGGQYPGPIDDDALVRFFHDG